MLNVRVLGTEFNISSYPEDAAINTVLIEGAVSICNKEIYNKAASLELKLDIRLRGIRLKEYYCRRG
jgi:hypothetical protein